MRTVNLGGALEVSALGLGCMGMSEFYGEAIEAVAPKGAFAGERDPDMRFVSGVTPTRN